MSIKIREFPDENYRAIYFNGKTIRQQYDPQNPIPELEYPEFYDVKITGKCNGKCPWCYQDSKPGDEHYMDALENIETFFGSMTENEKPFQVAIGGGEPTMHPDFPKILQAFHELDITPNYTTNAMHMSDDILTATRKYCGGVAVSCHEHLREYWEPFIKRMAKEKFKINLHIIISDHKSIERFIRIFKQYEKDVDYFVLLPHTEKGRAGKKELDHVHLFNEVERLNTKKIAFGALFHPHLIENKNRFKLSLYEPEIMSKYLDMKDMKLYKSSFAEEEIKGALA